jgi:hypothetical protein
VIDAGLIPILLPLIDCEDFDIWNKSVILVCNICEVSSVEKKNLIIKANLFDTLYKRLLKISPPPPAPILSSHYFPLSRICVAIMEVVRNNSSGVESLLKSPLIRCILWTLESASSIAITPSCTENVVNIQKWICGCFVLCSFYTYEQCRDIVNFGIVPAMLKLIETHVEEMKRKRKGMDGDVVEYASRVLFNITNNGFNKAESKQKNLFVSVFDSVEGTKRMLKIFDYLRIQVNQTVKEKEIVHYISISICRLFKSDTPPQSYESVLEYVKNLKSYPTPQNGFDFPLCARIAWNGMMNVE